MRKLAEGRLPLIGLALLALVTGVVVVLALTRTQSAGVGATSPAPSVVSPTATEASTTTTAAQPELTAVFLGDRYTAGAAWPDQAGQAAGWRVVNLAQAGMGYRVAPNSCEVRPCTAFEGLLPQVVEQQPEVVVLVGGEADGDYDLSTLADSTLEAYREALPEAQIYVLPPLSSQSPQPYWLTLHASILRDAAEVAGASFVDATTITRASASYQDGALTSEAGQQLAIMLATASG